jgi:hypothetical protein
MSFQKAHKISNELGAVYLVSPEVDINGGVSAASFPNQPFINGRNFRILDAGFTATTTTAAGGAVVIDDANVAATNYVVAGAVPILAGYAAGTEGGTVSTSKGSTGWAFDSAGNDSSGVPVVLSGQELRYTVGIGGTGTGYVWVKLAPQIQYKD